MPRYDIPVWKMCEGAGKELSDEFSAADVVRKVREKRPEVKKSTLQAHVIAMAPNHPTSKHYSLKHEAFYYLGHGRYRLLKPDDGPEKIEVHGMDEVGEEEPPGFSFEFEADLEEHLVNSLKDIEEGLELYVAPDGTREGQERTRCPKISL